MIVPGGKRVDLERLRDELAAVGITVPALGLEGNDLHTYGDGGRLDLPAAAWPVLQAHAPPPYVRPDAVLLAELRAARADYRAATTTAAKLDILARAVDALIFRYERAG